MTIHSLQPIFDDLLGTSLFAAANDQNGVFLPSERPVHRLGLALEAFPALVDWLAAGRLDALFLHRPWNLTEGQRAHLAGQGVGVLAYHLAFDERLTTGFNPALAERCGWGPPERFGEKEGRPLGMTCTLPAPRTFDDLAAQLEREFGGPLDLRQPRPLRQPRHLSGIASGFPVGKLAVVGAMTEPLVRAAHAAGVEAYVTGQFRQPARQAVEETGLGVIALGHHRSEVWGLHTLASLLQTQQNAPEIILPEIP